MIALTRKWAIASGFVVVAGAVAVQVVTSRVYQDNPLAGALSFLHTQPPSAVPPAPVSAPTPRPIPAPAPAELKPPAPAQTIPHFDVVRVEPGGGTVVAGQGAPDSSIALLSSGKVIGETKADSTGHFAFVPPALPPGDTTLTLRQTIGGINVESRQSVAVSVPEKGKDPGGLVVALTETGQATKLLVAPQTSKAALPDSAKAGLPAPANSVPVNSVPAQSVAIRSVELENGDGFFASGLAAPGTKLGIYLNNSHLADVVAGGDSEWSLKLRQGLMPGHYSVRADASSDGKSVTSRAEVPFDVPVAASRAAQAAVTANASPSPGPAAPPAPVATPAHAVIAQVRTTVVRSGDNLWDISRIQLGRGERYTRIYAANSAQIRDPKLIYPRQVFVMPPENN